MSTSPDAPPECPRHPGRVAYVRCQRCRRPACPECQRPAAVGVQCVTCVQEAARSAPQRRTPYGGDLMRERPIVTQGLIVLCVLVWLVQMASSRMGDGAVTRDFAFVPVLGWDEPWRFVTGAFLHSPNQVAHIAFNMLALFSVGRFLEQILGPWRFLALYLVSGVGGNVVVAWLARPPELGQVPTDDSWYTVVVGASGAVFGLFAALLLLNRSMGGDNRPMYAVLAINAVLSLFPGISWQAHVGGFVVGGLTALAIVRLRSPALRRYQWPAIGAIAALVVVAGVLRYVLLDPSVRSFGGVG